LKKTVSYAVSLMRYVEKVQVLAHPICAVGWC